MKLRYIVQHVITPSWITWNNVEDYALLDKAFTATGKTLKFDFLEFAQGTYEEAMKEMITFG